MKLTSGMKVFAVAVSVVVFAGLVQQSYAGEDLYDVLGVSRDSNRQEIKRAYVRLAKKWHPDKNKSPQAQEKMTEINRAYEVLSDDQKRSRYDMHGEVDPPSGSHQHRGGGFSFHTGHGHTFTFTFNPFGHHSQHQPGTDINNKFFFDKILPGSSKQPYLILFYHNFCFNCGEVQMAWESIRQEMTGQGIGMANAHTMMSSGVARHCRVSSVPAVVGVVNGQVTQFYGDVTVDQLKQFVDSLLPSDNVVELTSDNLVMCSDRITPNKPLAVLLSHRLKPSLSFKLIAFSFQYTMSCGFVTSDLSKSTSSAPVLQYLNASSGDKRLIIFKESPDTTVVLKGDELNSKSLKNALESHKLLSLPRISSSNMLDFVCPSGIDSLPCMLLIVSGKHQYSDSLTESYRHLAKQLGDSQEYRLGYIDENVQYRFLKPFKSSLSMSLDQCKDGASARPVLVLRRISTRRAVFTWYNRYCGDQKDWKEVEKLSFGSSLTKPVFLEQIIDENGPSFLYSLVTSTYQFILDIWATYMEQLAFLAVFIVPLVLLCCITLCATGHSEGTVPTGRIATPPQRQGQLVYRLTKEIYNKFLDREQKALVLVSQPGKQPLHQFFLCAQRYTNASFRWFYLPLESHKSTWIEDILEGVEERESIVDTIRLGGCVIIMMLVQKKRLYLLPYQNRTIVQHTGTMEGALGLGEEDQSSVNQFDEHQFSSQLYCWLDRVMDGTQIYYTVTEWPQDLN